MDRRSFFTGKARAAALTANPFQASRNIDSGLTPYTGTWTANEVAHLLKRTLFGARLADINYYKSMSVSQAVDAILNVTTAVATPPLKDYDNTDIDPADPDYALAQGTTWVNTISTNDTANGKRITSFKSWWIGQMINQDRTIQEKMVLFWHNHFATETNEYSRGGFAYKHNLLLRQYALGNFKQLVRAITIDPAMLRYLNGYLNVNTAPDENYGRELQELFTLGKENNPNYTEDDVQTAARVLTGWSIDFATEAVTFDPVKHDVKSKTFSSFYNGTVIAGRSDANAGDAELDDLLTMIFNKSTEVSEFIIRKLYRWFCYYTIDDATEVNVIQPLALLFRNSNWEIKPVLATLFKSEHFFDPLNQGCMIKSPIDLVVGLLREYNVPAVIADTSNVAEVKTTYGLWDYLRSTWAAFMQQNLGDPPSVSGWPAYYQLPQFHEMWINSDTLPKRNRYSDAMIGMGYMIGAKTLKIDAVAFTKTLSNPGDPNQLINDSLTILYRVPISDSSKQLIKKQILLTNQDQDYYWSNAWNAHLANPSDNAAYQVVLSRLEMLYKYLMNLAEYQLA